MKRGEVWLVNLFPTLGAEIQKTRPAVIVNDDEVGVLPLKIIVSITDWKDRYSEAPWMIRVEPTAENGLSKISSADTFQVRSISEQRFLRRLGALAPETMDIIAEGLKIVMKLND